MATFVIPTNPYGYRLFARKAVEFAPGFTCLVGCNGSGKSTLISLIKENLNKNKDILVLSYDDRYDGGHSMMEKFGFQGKTQDLAIMMFSSEGERIHRGVEDFATGMAGKIRRQRPSELWIFLDAVGSGLSIDGIQEVKDFADAVFEDNIGKRDVYFVVSTNEYEFAEGSDCIDVTTFDHVTFSDYDSYRKFILQTKEKKDRRIERLASKT